MRFRYFCPLLALRARSWLERSIGSRASVCEECYCVFVEGNLKSERIWLPSVERITSHCQATSGCDGSCECMSAMGRGSEQGRTGCFVCRLVLQRSSPFLHVRGKLINMIGLSGSNYVQVKTERIKKPTTQYYATRSRSLCKKVYTWRVYLTQ